MTSERLEAHGRARGVVLAVFWVAVLDACLRSLDLLNDHFGRISPGRQIVAFGELPFRDFLDPGYFLTEFSSAAVQRVFGQNLLGEILLNSLFITTGCLLVCLLALRLGRGLAASLAAGVFALLAMPRAYDYDKVLLYPLGLWLAWRWFELPSRSRLLSLSAGLVVAAGFRYDNGVFLGLAVLVGITVLCIGNRRRWLTLAASIVAVTAVLSAQILIFLQLNGGIATAFDQALTYGLREGARTRITSRPPIRLGHRFAVVLPFPKSENFVHVRWAPSVSTPAQRQQLAARLGLQDEQQAGAAENRTWLYTLPDASVDNLRRLVSDPAVEDTDGIDRGKLTLLVHEPMAVRLQRLSPVFRVRVIPDAWTAENAQAVLFYVLWLLPVVSASLLGVTWQQQTDVRRAQLASAIVLCLCLDAFILRDPVSARVGGMAGPFCVLAVWSAAQAVRLGRAMAGRATHRAFVLATGTALIIAIWSLSATANWSQRLSLPFLEPGALRARLERLAQAPNRDQLPSGREEGLIRYVHDCTQADDRVFVSWFMPELYYFAQRGFAGGVSANFGEHWSEPRFQRRSIAALAAHPTPLVILLNGSESDFRRTYPLLDAYFAAHYTLAGVTDFGDPDVRSDAYRVLVRADRQPTGTDRFWGLPCFGSGHSL